MPRRRFWRSFVLRSSENNSIISENFTVLFISSALCYSEDETRVAAKGEKKMRKLAVLVVLSLFLLMIFANFCVATGKNEASSKISEADSALKIAFKSVWEAERVGANVSGLVSDLKIAENFLAEAEIAFANGDLNGTISKADQCITIANSVQNDATILFNLASANLWKIFWLTLTFSSVGAIAFVIFLTQVWGRFKRSYFKKMMKMKPEVA